MLLYCLFRAQKPFPVSDSLDAHSQFMRQFRTYEDTLRRTGKTHISLQPELATLRYLFFRVTVDICNAVVQYMNWFSEEEAQTIYSAQQQQSAATKAKQQQQQTHVPKPTVLALYKMKEFYIPVYNRSSFDQDMLCYVCKLQPIYKPCTRLNKKISLRRYNCKCLQCFIEHQLSIDSTCFDGTKPSPKDVPLYKSSLECPCHRNYYLLLFPSFMMYASESSHKIVIRARIMKEIGRMFGLSSSDVAIVPVTASPLGSPLSAPLFASSSWTKEKKQYADKHYIYQVISGYLTDHFMVCSGACAEMRGILLRHRPSSLRSCTR